MKKIAAVCNMLIILSILIGCSLSNNPMQNEEQLLLEKEKKTQVEEKKHTTKHWKVELTSKLVDTRTMTEQYNNTPPKNDIVNTVLFSSKIPGNSLKTQKGTPYYPSFEVQKTIKQGTNEIIFTINTDILTFSDIRLSSIKPLHIQLSPENIVDFNTTDVEILYKENPEMTKAGGIKAQNIICKLSIPLEIINKIRTAENGVTVLLKTSDDVFKIPLPKIFIGYLREL